MKLIYCIAAFLVGTFCFALESPLHAQDDDVLKELEAVAVIDQKLMVPMRDGVRLATDVYRPKTDEPVPIIFSKTPYNFNTWRDGEMSTRTYRAALDAVTRGYA